RRGAEVVGKADAPGLAPDTRVGDEAKGLLVRHVAGQRVVHEGLPDRVPDRIRALRRGGPGGDPLFIARAGERRRRDRQRKQEDERLTLRPAHLEPPRFCWKAVPCTLWRKVELASWLGGGRLDDQAALRLSQGSPRLGSNPGRPRPATARQNAAR